MERIKKKNCIFMLAAAVCACVLLLSPAQRYMIKTEWWKGRLIVGICMAVAATVTGIRVHAKDSEN
jgi:hypothetical protein